MRVKISSPRLVDISYRLKGSEQAINLTGDMHQQSKVSATVPSARLLEFPSLKEAFIKHFSSTAWRVDDGPDSFAGAADAAYVKAGLPVVVYPSMADTRGPHAPDWEKRLAGMRERGDPLKAQFKFHPLFK